jgi:hypothetical protein
VHSCDDVRPKTLIVQNRVLIHTYPCLFERASHLPKQSKMLLMRYSSPSIQTNPHLSALHRKIEMQNYPMYNRPPTPNPDSLLPPSSYLSPSIYEQSYHHKCCESMDLRKTFSALAPHTYLVVHYADELAFSPRKRTYPPREMEGDQNYNVHLVPTTVRL